MVLRESGLICGGEYAPTLTRFGQDNLAKVTFTILFPRGGNRQQSWDIFTIKYFDQSSTNRCAEKLFHQLCPNGKFDESFQGKTVMLQFSLENKIVKLENGVLVNNAEMIATYISFNTGISMMVDGAPDYARPVNCCTTKATKKETPIQELAKENGDGNDEKEVKMDNVVSAPDVKKSCDVDTQESVTKEECPQETKSVTLISPVGCIAEIRLLKEKVDAAEKAAKEKKQPTEKDVERKNFRDMFDSMMWDA